MRSLALAVLCTLSAVIHAAVPKESQVTLAYSSTTRTLISPHDRPIATAASNDTETVTTIDGLPPSPAKHAAVDDD